MLLNSYSPPSYKYINNAKSTLSSLQIRSIHVHIHTYHIMSYHIISCIHSHAHSLLHTFTRTFIAACMHACMHAWMDGWMDGGRGGGMEAWRDGGIEGWMDGWMHIFVYRYSIKRGAKCFGLCFARRAGGKVREALAGPPEPQSLFCITPQTLMGATRAQLRIRKKLRSCDSLRCIVESDSRGYGREQLDMGEGV